MSSTKEENKKIEQAFLRDTDRGIITDGYCDGEAAQTQFDQNEKDKPPQTDN